MQPKQLTRKPVTMSRDFANLDIMMVGLGVCYGGCREKEEFKNMGGDAVDGETSKRSRTRIDGRGMLRNRR